MDVCGLAINNAKKVFEKSKARAVKLRETVAITREGEVLDKTIEIAENAIKNLNERDFTNLDSYDRTELLNSLTGVLLREELTDVFEGGIARNATSTTPRKPLVLKSAKFETDKNGVDVLTIKVTPEGENKTWTYSFERGSNVSTHTLANGNRLYIPRFSATHEQVLNAVFNSKKGLTLQEEAVAAKKAFADIRAKLEENKNINELLGSVSGSKHPFNFKRASLKQNYNHGDIQHMKNMLADLHALDNNSITDEVYKQYNDLLDSMHPQFFRKMNLYIDENAKHTAGWVDIDKNHILLNISSNKLHGMSNEEIYMHETIHSMTAWALKQEGFTGSRLRSRLNYLRGVAYKNIRWQDLAKAHPNMNLKDVKERYDYIFNGKTSDEEFVAFALSNPEFIGLLKNVKIREKNATTLLGALKEFFTDLMNALMGNYDFKQRNSDLHTEIHALAFKLAEINNTADESLNRNIFSMVGDLVDRAEGSFEEWFTGLEGYFDTNGEPLVVPENMNKAQKVIVLLKFFMKGIYNKQQRHQVGRYLTIVGIKPTNSIREIFRSIMPNLNDSFVTEKLHLQTVRIDALRNTQIAVTLEDILKKFKQKPSEEVEEALTSVFLESNGSALFTKGYSNDKIQKILTDINYRKRTIGRVKAQLRRMNGKRANWLIAQAEGLGRLMATGQGHEAQLTNSKSIVLGHGTKERHRYDDNLFHKVEELAALKAIDYQKQNVLTNAAITLKNEPEAIKNIVNLYEAFKKASQEELFQNDISHMTEGYIKELFDDTIEVRYEALADEEEMKKKGFSLVSRIDADTLSGGRELGIYVSQSYSQAERLRGAVALGNPHSRGLNLKEIRYKQFGDSKKHAQIYFEADKAKLSKKSREIREQLEAGVSYDSIPLGSVPILDASGRIVNYRNMMNKELKAKFLKQDKKVSNVLAKTLGSITDKVARIEQNKKALELIKEHMRKVVDNPSHRDHEMEHTVIKADHHDPAIRQLYFMLPKIFQNYAESRADKSLHVPSILMDQYFGYKHHRLGDMPLINLLPSTVKHIMNIMESLWQDLVKIAKGNILLKIPAVPISNVISNIVFALVNGINPKELILAYKDSYREVKAFMKLHKDYETKKVQLASLTQNYRTSTFTSAELEKYFDETKRLQDEVNRLEYEMGKSEVKELFDMGMYQSVVEYVETYKLGDTNQISNGMDKLLKKVPTIIKTPLQVLYLSKETAWYKANQEFLQVSDLIARDVMNRKWKLIEKQQADGKKDLPLEYRKAVNKMGKEDQRRKLEGHEREEFFKIMEKNRYSALLHSFVNYNLPNGKGEEYLNRIGVLMFTKFLKRIQQVITTSGIKHPIRTAAAVAFSSFLIDVDMIQDQSLITRGLNDYDYGFLGIVPVYSPIDTIIRVTNPPLVDLVWN